MCLLKAITANGICLYLLVPSPARCCFFSASCLRDGMYCGINRWAYFQERKAPFATTSFKKVVYFCGWVYFQKITVLVSIAMATELSLHISEPLENPTKAVDTIYESIYYLQSHCFVEYVKAHTRWPQLRAYTHVAQCVCAKESDKDSTDNGCFSYKPWRS